MVEYFLFAWLIYSDQKTLSESVADSERRITELRRRIVKSPERVKTEIHNMGDIVLERRQEVQQHQELYGSLQAKFDKLVIIERVSHQT